MRQRGFEAQANLPGGGGSSYQAYWDNVLQGSGFHYFSGNIYGEGGDGKTGTGNNVITIYGIDIATQEDVALITIQNNFATVGIYTGIYAPFDPVTLASTPFDPINVDLTAFKPEGNPDAIMINIGGDITASLGVGRSFSIVDILSGGDQGWFLYKNKDAFVGLDFSASVAAGFINFNHNTNEQLTRDTFIGRSQSENLGVEFTTLQHTVAFTDGNFHPFYNPFFGKFPPLLYSGTLSGYTYGVDMGTSVTGTLGFSNSQIIPSTTLIH